MILSTSTGDLIHESHSIAGAIKGISQAGFRHFNIEFDHWINHAELKQNISDIQSVLQETGSDAVLAHSACFTYDKSNLTEIIDETLFDIKACQMLGIKDIVVHPLCHPSFGMREMYKFNKSFYTELLDRSADTDINLLIENFGDSEQHSSVFASGMDMREFIEYIDSPRIAGCWDTAHCNLCAAPRDDQYENIVALGDKLRALHVSDNYGIGMHLHSFPLSGVIDFDSVLYALKDINYKGAFNFEASYTIRYHRTCPRARKSRPDYNGRPALLLDPSMELRIHAEKLLYECGRFLLTQHGLTVE